MKVIPDIFREITAEVSKEYGSRVSYMFGDSVYINETLTTWGKNPETAELKYPIIILYTPFKEEKTDYRYYCRTNLDFLIAVNAQKGYMNEDRLNISFKQVLHPIYEIFIEKVKKNSLFDFEWGFVKHIYSDNLTYGSVGAKSADVKEFNDYFDGIDINKLQLTIKKEKICYGKRLQSL